MAARLTHLS